MKILFKRKDPHSVYYRIIPFFEEQEYQCIIRRGLIEFDSDIYVLRLFLMLLGDVIAFYKCIKFRKKTIILIEFSAISVLVFLFPLSFVIGLRNISLNINHNLNNKTDRSLLLPLISKRFEIVFIEAPSTILTQFKYLKNITLKSLAIRNYKKNNLYLFAGNRDEQLIKNYETYIDRVSEDCKSNINIHVVGSKKGRKLTDLEYKNIFQKNSCIVLLYDTEKYMFRHSGVVLESLTTGTLLLMKKTDLSNHYVNKGFNVDTFNSLDELIILIKKL